MRRLAPVLAVAWVAAALSAGAMAQSETCSFDWSCPECGTLGPDAETSGARTYRSFEACEADRTRAISAPGVTATPCACETQGGEAPVPPTTRNEPEETGEPDYRRPFPIPGDRTIEAYCRLVGGALAHSSAAWAIGCCPSDWPYLKAAFADAKCGTVEAAGVACACYQTLPKCMRATRFAGTCY